MTGKRPVNDKENTICQKQKKNLTTDSAASTITKAAESPLHEIDNAGAQDEMPKPQVIEPSDKQHIDR